MATMAAAATRSRRYARHLEGDRRLRSRNHDRVVRLLHLWQARHSDLATVLSQRQQHARADRLPVNLCGRLCGAAVRRAVLRAHRRSGRAQVCLPGHAADHGRRDGADRLPADLCDDRHTRADHAAGDPHLAGPGAGRRVRRRGSLCGRARAGSTSAASTPASSRSPRRWACSSRWRSFCWCAELDEQQRTFSGWGWRMPFLLSILLVGMSLYIRLRMKESPIFTHLKSEPARPRRRRSRKLRQLGEHAGVC